MKQKEIDTLFKAQNRKMTTYSREKQTKPNNGWLRTEQRKSFQSEGKHSIPQT